MGSRPDPGLTCQVERIRGDVSVVKHDEVSVKLRRRREGSYELSPETPAGRERCSESDLPPLPPGKCLRSAGCLSDQHCGRDDGKVGQTGQKEEEVVVVIVVAKPHHELVSWV